MFYNNYPRLVVERNQHSFWEKGKHHHISTRSDQTGQRNEKKQLNLNELK